MNAKLEFDLNEPCEKQQLERMLKAKNLCSVICDMREYLRSRLKYTEKFKSGKKELKEIREKLIESLECNNINLDEIYQ